MNVDPLRPYVALACCLITLTLFTGLFVAGCVHGEGNGADALRTMKTDRDAWKASAQQAASAVDAQRKANAKRAAEAERAAREADTANDVATQARERAEARARSLDAQLQDARKRPTCAALLDADLLRECGL